MVVKNAIKVLVDVVEHVDHFHGCAVVAECGEAHDVTEVDGDLLKQLWFHFARLLQGAHHRAGGRGTCDSYLLGSRKGFPLEGRRLPPNPGRILQVLQIQTCLYTSSYPLSGMLWTLFHWPLMDQQANSLRSKIHFPYQVV